MEDRETVLKTEFKETRSLRSIFYIAILNRHNHLPGLSASGYRDRERVARTRPGSHGHNKK
jgi:hypothetical protein